jgi:hypothetical protein
MDRELLLVINVPSGGSLFGEMKTESTSSSTPFAVRVSANKRGFTSHMAQLSSLPYGITFRRTG